MLLHFLFRTPARRRRLYPLADMYRLRTQCIKSAYVYAALHRGFQFPTTYSALNNEQLIRGQEIQWTLGALLYRMRFYPLAEQQQRRQQQQHQQQLRHHGSSGGPGDAGIVVIKPPRAHDHDSFFDRDVPFSQYLLLALILLFIAVIAALARRLRRWFVFRSESAAYSRVGMIFRPPESIDCPGGQRLRKSSESRYESLLA